MLGNSLVGAGLYPAPPNAARVAGELSAGLGLLEPDLQGVPAGSGSPAGAVPPAAGQPGCAFPSSSNPASCLPERLPSDGPGQDPAAGAPSAARLYLTGGKQGGSRSWDSPSCQFST